MGFESVPDPRHAKNAKDSESDVTGFRDLAEPPDRDETEVYNDRLSLCLHPPFPYTVD